ncbi:unnamed protein product [Schistocephalus solidus]|uniref:Endo/exonuclease/phosphatase domain-containing protein n=1 Tax=Schistocephalus solidus TaxID=70667 RepID=A0A183S8E5_SCHSO|nr:unnamed protein product [Schistocephalus solidus]
MADKHIPLRDVEVLSITISAMYSRPLTISVVYRSPYQTTDQDLILITELCKASEKKDVLIFGDFNATGIDWKTWTAQGMPDDFNPKLLQWAIKKLPCQYVTFGTRSNQSTKSNYSTDPTPESTALASDWKYLSLRIDRRRFYLCQMNTLERQ